MKGRENGCVETDGKKLIKSDRRGVLARQLLFPLFTWEGFSPSGVIESLLISERCPAGQFVQRTVIMLVQWWAQFWLCSCSCTRCKFYDCSEEGLRISVAASVSIWSGGFETRFKLCRCERTPRFPSRSKHCSLRKQPCQNVRESTKC